MNFFLSSIILSPTKLSITKMTLFENVIPLLLKLFILFLCKAKQSNEISNMILAYHSFTILQHICISLMTMQWLMTKKNKCNANQFIGIKYHFVIDTQMNSILGHQWYDYSSLLNWFIVLVSIHTYIYEVDIYRCWKTFSYCALYYT